MLKLSSINNEDSHGAADNILMDLLEQVAVDFAPPLNDEEKGSVLKICRLYKSLPKWYS